MEIIKLVDKKINFTCLHLFHYNVDAILVNRIYPKQAMEGYFNKWMIRQEESLNEIKESFSEVPKFYIELQKEELRTLPILKKTGDEVFKNTEADDVLFSREIYRLEQEKGEITLRIFLPFAQKEELNLVQDKNDLIISVKNESRRFPVPLAVNGKDIAGAGFEDGYLNIKW